MHMIGLLFSHWKWAAYDNKLLRAMFYSIAPAIRPLTIGRSGKLPITKNGKLAADEMAAMLHQLILFEPVWSATTTSKVLAYVLVSDAVKKYSFQHRMTARIMAATMLGSQVTETGLLRNRATVSRMALRQTTGGRPFSINSASAVI